MFFHRFIRLNMLSLRQMHYDRYSTINTKVDRSSIQFKVSLVVTIVLLKNLLKKLIFCVF